MKSGGWQEKFRAIPQINAGYRAKWNSQILAAL
jgi:hypothetical protein